MDRQSSLEIGIRRSLLSARVVRDLAPALAILLGFLQAFTALVLVERRLAGALAPAAAPGWLLAGVAVSALLAAAIRCAWFSGDRGRAIAGDRLAAYVPLVSLLLTTVALSTWHAPLLLAALVWLIAGGEEYASLRLWGSEPGLRLGATWLRFQRWPGRRRDEASAQPQQRVFEPGGRLRWPLFDLPGPDAERADSSALRSAIPQSALAGARCVQRLERLQSDDGGDRLVASLTTSFAAGESTTHVHVAFCPPFARLPQLEYRQISGPPSRIRVGQLLPHGVRFDMKLAGLQDAPAELVLEMRATDEPCLDQAMPKDDG